MVQRHCRCSFPELTAACLALLLSPRLCCKTQPQKSPNEPPRGFHSWLNWLLLWFTAPRSSYSVGWLCPQASLPSWGAVSRASLPPDRGCGDGAWGLGRSLFLCTRCSWVLRRAELETG